MIKKLILLVSVSIPSLLMAQEPHNSGRFELGMRQTASLFGHENSAAIGTGGHFRLMLGKRLNTEWFADYMVTDISNLGKRNDAHIGWSVMFYLLNKEHKIEPYVIAGHCFDYTRVTVFNTLISDQSDQTSKRWSSAAQVGLGAQYHLSNRFNLSFTSQYMVHLGKDIHTQLDNSNGINQLEIEVHDDLTFEGHLFLTLGLNIKIADLW